MSIWESAENTLDMGNAVLLSLQVFDRLSRSDVVAAHSKMALLVVRAVVVTMMEGFQGKLKGRVIMRALVALKTSIDESNGIPTQDAIDKFKESL